MKSGDKWQFPQELEIVDFVNKAQESSFYISYDGLYLFSAIDDGNSYGDIDIYVSEKLDDGRWSKPENLGPDINTASKEGAPFLTADGQTLYFSSAGWPGYGSMDIFRSYKKDSFHSWAEPQNVGPGINSETWDSYFTIPLDGVNGYYVSMKSGYGKEDIFRVAIPEGVMKQEVVQVSGVVTDSEESSPVAATVIYEDISTGEKMGVANTNSESGEYSVVLLPNRTYGIRAEANGYFPINKNLEIGIIDSILITEGKTIDLKLVKIKKGATITLNNIFFDFGESKLLKTSALELTRVADFLKNNKEINIKVIGHTDNVGTDTRNKVVSEERAEAVKSFLVNKGITDDRILAIGMGKDSPVSGNDTPEGRAMNRRVEFVIE
jgi:outer membrane protein OmpA-like peptidoglycan-associated protein